MAKVTIDGLDDDVVEFHALRARAQGRSLEEQLRELVTKAARPDKAELVESFRRIRAANRPPPPGVRWPTAEEMVREDRDSR
jgi:antitoxin FitA